VLEIQDEAYLFFHSLSYGKHK